MVPRRAALQVLEQRLTRDWRPAAGLALALAIALAGQALAQPLGAWLFGMAKSPLTGVTLAVLLGLLLANTLKLPAFVESGAHLAVTHVLRAGILLLGFRLSFADAVGIGAQGLPVIAVTISCALLLVTLLGRALGLPPRLATLIGVGTGICGATAIAATAPTIGARAAETSYAVACIVLFGMSAMLVYPLLAHWLFEGDALRAGLFFGSAVPDTSQVVGAGMAYREYYDDPRALEVATVTKMMRNLAMIGVIPLMSIRFHARAAASDPCAPPPRWYSLVPLFVLGFAAASALRSVGDLGPRPFGALDPAAWQRFIDTARIGADLLLATAMAALGLSTRVATLREIGLRPLAVAFGCTLTVGAASALAAVLST
jgi:uncharacterized integral membrane protein (TIGR00698 family)